MGNVIASTNAHYVFVSEDQHCHGREGKFSERSSTITRTITTRLQQQYQNKFVQQQVLTTTVPTSTVSTTTVSTTAVSTTTVPTQTILATTNHATTVQQQLTTVFAAVRAPRFTNATELQMES